MARISITRLLPTLAPVIDALEPVEMRQTLAALGRGDVFLVRVDDRTEVRVITPDGITTLGTIDTENHS